MPELDGKLHDIAPIDAHLLFGGCTGDRVNNGNLGATLRRMGLSPLPGSDAAVRGLFADSSWLIRLGDAQAITGLASSSALATATLDDGAISTAGSIDVGAMRSATTLLCEPQWPSSADGVAACRELFKLAIILADAVEAASIFWSPAGLWSDMPTFRNAVAEMLSSGMPPLMHLVAFNYRPDGMIVTRGLRFFAGQELQLLPGSGLDRRESVRRLARLALDIMMHGAISFARSFPGLIDGERIRVGPATGADGSAILIVTITPR